MALFVAGLLGIGFFYALILGVGLWASRKAKDESEEEMMLAGRNLGFSVGILTLIATWVGGGYVNGASEAIFKQGLLWLQVPVGYSLSLFVGAILFVKPMRDMNIVTLLDPFQEAYGEKIGALLFMPAILGDFFWVASILNALGSSLVVITDIDPVISVVLSAAFVAAYTSVGAMYAVTYTDVVQMFFILAGLVLCVPFAANNEAADLSKLNDLEWIGHIDQQDIPYWIDLMLLLILGGIPWQGYMQRVLAIKSTRTAQILSSAAALGCVCMAIPAVGVGLIARTVDWTMVPSFNRTLTEHDANIILPLVLRHLTPEVVAFFGLGGISAAVMSSADSSILAFSATFSRNVYKNLFRSKASQREIAWVLRGTVLFISALSTFIALLVPSIYYLAVLSSDLIYVILFPNLLLVVYCNGIVNSYGCLGSFFLGTLLRVMGGEPGLGIPPLLKYPMYDDTRQMQLFPHRTFAMLVCMVSHLLISWATRKAFNEGHVSTKYDVLKVFKIKKEKNEPPCDALLLADKKSKR